MPEGVEITILRDILEPKIKDTVLQEVEILSGRYMNGKPKGYARFVKDLPLKVKNVKNKGKFLYIEMDENWSIWVTFGMTGYFYDEENEHSRLAFTFKKGRKKIKLYYNDQRNFGTIKFDNYENLKKKLKTLGPDMLNEKVTFDQFKKIIDKVRNKEKQIVMVLNDQKVMAGIGNYLRAEILYDAKLSPFRTLKSLKEADLKKLHKSIIKIMKKSYEGQKKDNFIKESEYIENYEFQVYGADKDKKGNKVSNEKLEDGRTIWFVKNEQK